MHETVTARALMARINRRLKDDYQQVRIKGARLASQTDFGEYYLMDLNRNCIVSRSVDLETLARELNALSPGESLDCDD